jgi:cell division protein FtsW
MVAITTGLVVLLLMFHLDYRRLRSLAPIVASAALFLLLLVLIPPFGFKLQGGCRSLPIGPLYFNPSELAGPAMVLFMAHVLARNRYSRGVLTVLGCVVISGSLVYLQPDFSTALVLNLTAFVVLLIAVKQRLWVLTFGLGVLAVFLRSLSTPERIRRLLAFFYADWADITRHWPPLAAIKSGGWFGLGLGQITTIKYYRYEASNDFISALIGKELGWITLIVTAILFILFAAAGFYVSHRAPNRFGRLLGFGICSFIVIQALVHFAVVFHFLPIRGVALPFVSQGGIGFIVMMGAVGTLLNIASCTDSTAVSVEPHHDEKRK